MQQTTTYHEIGSTFGQKSLKRPSGCALAPLGVPKGSQTEFWDRQASSLDPPCSMQDSSDFLFDLWMHVALILHALWMSKCIQHWVRNGKRVFLILSVSCRRELNLEGFGTPKSINMMSENRLEN